LSIVLVFSAVVLVLIGAEGSDKKALQDDWVALTCLIVYPIASSLGVIAMRKMKEMHYMVVSTYKNIFMAFFSISMIVASPNLDFKFVQELTAKQWLLFVLLGLMMIGDLTLKFSALKFQQASKLQKLAFLPCVWQFLIDLLLVQQGFEALQIVGFCIIFAFYIFEIVEYIVISYQKKRPNSEDDGFKRAEDKKE